ncbi:unnamed protein product [Paramecium pentaurelia]|uniref:Uncharacterized protein n=1 Tax=Paramecium pentaurelia TaxID=43138 RepID=A0A8S1WAD5_9CILI|nr:unnamed protein product [Paramecium pentaurelia]
MSNINFMMNKSIQKCRNHKRIDNQKKHSLINLVLHENLSTRQAAQKLQIKYSTAKYIVKKFKNKGNNLDQHKQNLSKQKSMVSNVSIIIDVLDGNITLLRNSTKQSYYDLNSLQEELKYSNLLQTSEFIFQKLGKIPCNQINYRNCNDSEFLKAQLLKQHQIMKNL